MAIASLGMYALPAIADAIESWWAGLARAFRAAGLESVPERLSAGDVQDHWRDPALLLSQTCGYPLTHAFAPHLRVVATPAYDAPGCAASRYRSAFVVREDEPAASLAQMAGRRAAANSRDSQSGYSALRHAVGPLAGGRPFFSTVLESGSHGGSMQAVAEGRADLASIDCVTLALHQRHLPALADALRILDFSEAAPGLPYVTAAGRSDEEVARLREGLREAGADPDLAEARQALMITGFEVLPDGAYGKIVEMEKAAQALGYPELQ